MCPCKHCRRRRAKEKEVTSFVIFSHWLNCLYQNLGWAPTGLQNIAANGVTSLQLARRAGVVCVYKSIVCYRACARANMCACVIKCVYVRARGCVCVFARACVCLWARATSSPLETHRKVCYERWIWLSCDLMIFFLRSYDFRWLTGRSIWSNE